MKGYLTFDMRAASRHNMPRSAMMRCGRGVAWNLDVGGWIDAPLYSGSCARGDGGLHCRPRSCGLQSALGALEGAGCCPRQPGGDGGRDADVEALCHGCVELL